MNAAPGMDALLAQGASGNAVGYDPMAPPIWVGGELYGTTTKGALHDHGSLYGLTSAKDAFVLHSFKLKENAQYPLTNFDGTLYGTVPYGGTTGNGSIFAFDRKTGQQAFFYNFGKGPDASLPGELTRAGSMLYATSNHGGANGYGSIFTFDPSTGKEQVVYSFRNAADGRYPMLQLANDNGVLFGYTYGGGTNNNGVIFSYDTATQTFNTVYSVGATDSPIGNLVYLNGKVFGDYYNGSNWTLFSIDPSTGTLTPIANGGIIDQLIAGGNNLYGLRISGGKYGYGEIVKIDQTNGTPSTFYAFPSRFLVTTAVTYGDGKFYSTGFQPPYDGTVMEYGQGYQKLLYTF